MAQVKEAEKVLVAVGRSARTADIGIAKTKVELDRGFVKVNEAQETAEPGVFATLRHRGWIAAAGARRAA